jgi:hypothetical protein
MKTKTIKSSIIFQGPSLIDGSPIVVIAISTSSNRKTGNMLQTYIIRSDMDPLSASKTGADFAICGNCKHRGIATNNPVKRIAENRTCYVNLGQGVNQVYKAFKAGKYASATPEQTQQIGHGRMIRLGTYGDPAAVPQQVWDALLSQAHGHTGYTHQHDKNPDYKRMMYSADTPAEAQQAHKNGFRTFRVIPIGEYKAQGKNALLKNEILCPASEEAGKRSTCNDCKLCSGNQTKAKSIAIVAHGTAKNKV